MRALLLALALIQSAPIAIAQDATTKNEFFSGTVVSFTATELVVYRKTLTSDPVTKTFVIDESTKVEGVLKAKARVTVRFASEGQPVRAIEIIVR